MNLILAIDQSTSATKAILFDAGGKVLDEPARVTSRFIPGPAAWNTPMPRKFWRNVLAVIREVVGRNRKKLKWIAALSLTNQRETVLVFDRHTGKPLHNAIVWQCRRGDDICRKLSAQAGHDAAVPRRSPQDWPQD